MDLRDKYLNIIHEAMRNDAATTKATNKYAKASNGRKQAIDDFANGKIDEAEFMKAMKKAGFGESRSKEILKQALVARKEIDSKKAEEIERNKWRSEVAQKAAKRSSGRPTSTKVVNGVVQSNGIMDLSRKLGKLLLPH